MQPLRHILWTLTILTVVSCRQRTTKETTKISDTLQPEAGQLSPINFSDTLYYDLGSYATDTVTADGWKIKYLVRNDSTKYKDLYISCSKGNKQSIYKADNVLKYRRYFVPGFEAETKRSIYFSHGCATDCSAILVFSKDSTLQFADYEDVIKSNFQFGQILFVTDSSYKNEEKIYEIALADVDKHKVHKLTFHGVCDGVYKPACVDTVIFSKTKVSVTVSLRNSIEDTDQTKQTKTVRL